MRVITEIQKIGKGERYKLFLDDDFYGIFEAEILAKHHLKSGESYEDEFFEELTKENGDYACFNRSLSLLEKSMKSEKMLRNYLREKAYPKECIENACEKLKSYGYIDDEAFAENYISIYGDSKSRRKLKIDLIGKGISEEIIDVKLDECLSDNENEKCLKFAEKFMKNREYDLKNKQKLYNHLASKGFTYEDISNVWRELSNGRD